MAKKPKKPITDEIASIRQDDIFFEFIGKKLTNPDAILSKESRGKGITVFDEMLRDTHVFSEMQSRVLAVISKEYEVIPASEKRQDTKIAEFVREVFENFSFDRACGDLLFGNIKGFSVGEIMWEMSEGDVWIKDIKHRAQRRFVFSPDEDLRLLTPQALIEGVELPERKFNVVTWGFETETPYGNPLGNKLYWPWWFKKHGIKWWLIFQEKFAQPTPLGKYPPGTDKPAQTKLLNTLNAIQTDSGIVIPENMLVEFLEASRSGRDNYKSFPDFMNAEISKAVLGQTLTTESGEKGARSLGEVHERVKNVLVKADADLLCASLNNQVIRWLVDYNFPGQMRYPRVWRRLDEERDLKALAERDRTLVRDIGLPVAKKYFYDTYGIPEPEEDEEVIEIRSGKPAEKENKPAEFADPALGEGDEPDTVEHMSERLLDEAPVDKLIKPLSLLIQKARSLAEVRDGLLDLYVEMDESKTAERIGEAMVAADLSGRYEAGNST